jgi:hypothetical protein
VAPAQATYLEHLGDCIIAGSNRKSGGDSGGDSGGGKGSEKAASKPVRVYVSTDKDRSWFGSDFLADDSAVLSPVFW